MEKEGKDVCSGWMEKKGYNERAGSRIKASRRKGVEEEDAMINERARPNSLRTPRQHR